MDYGRLIRTGLLDWWKKPSLQRWFVFVGVLYFVFSLIEISTYEVEPPIGQMPSGVSSRLHGEFFFLPTLPGEFSILSIISAILMAFAGREVLMWRGLPAKPINIRKGLMFFLLGIYQLIVILLLRMDFKWLVVPVVSLILILAGVISNGLGLPFESLAFLGIPGLLAYLGLLVYHWYRLAFSNIFWLSEPVSMSSALRKSWEFTRGRTGELFLGLLVAWLVVGIVVAIVAIIGLALINGLTEFSYNATIRLVGITIEQLVNDIGVAFLSLAGLAIITEAFIQFGQSAFAPTELRVHKEPEGKSLKVFFSVALAVGALLVGFMVFVPSSDDSRDAQPLATNSYVPEKSTPYPFLNPNSNQKTYTNSIGMEFVQIPAGEFDMGSPPNEVDRYDNEDPVHHVKISNAFYISKYEVTQKQWSDIMGTNPSYFKGDNLPVEQVSWNDVQGFIKKLNVKEGTNKYRLPSEAEWEYAARAGTTTRYSFGDDESMLIEYAWYTNNSDDKTHEVGQKKPNPWGLYDMHGNVWEWVRDIYNVDYDGAPTNGSAWEVKVTFWFWGKDNRVIRGGGWGHIAGNCRSADRDQEVPGSPRKGDMSGRDDDLGFRLERDL
jgi:formylglycine-generating enzyme required for sulfatase activity